MRTFIANQRRADRCYARTESSGFYSVGSRKVALHAFLPTGDVCGVATFVDGFYNFLETIIVFGRIRFERALR